MNSSNESTAMDRNELGEVDLSKLTVDDEKVAKKPIILPVINLHHDPQVLIFDLNDLKTLRNDHGILGVLIGTLSQYPQQNFFLSVPLRLFVWEVIWLVENDIGVLIDQVSYRRDKLIRQTGHKSQNTVSLNRDGSINDNESCPNFIVTRNTDEVTNSDEDLLLKHQIHVQDYITAYVQCNSETNHTSFVNNYHNYKYFKQLGYFISPGLKFGGDFVLYPSDPLRFHSHSVVKLNTISVNDIVVGGRLTTGVKKNFVIIEDNGNRGEGEDEAENGGISMDKLYNSSPQKAFSIEWAGFG